MGDITCIEAGSRSSMAATLRKSPRITPTPEGLRPSLSLPAKTRSAFQLDLRQPSRRGDLNPACPARLEFDDQEFAADGAGRVAPATRCRAQRGREPASSSSGMRASAAKPCEHAALAICVDPNREAKPMQEENSA